MSNNLIALVLGDNAGNKVKNSISRNLDNYRFNVFNSLPEMLNSAQEHEQEYSRIVVYENRLTSPNSEKGKVFDDDTDPRFASLKGVNEYLETNSDTELVVICDKGEYFTNVSNFIDTYMKSPNITPVILQSNGVKSFEELASETMANVRSKHYSSGKKKSASKTVKQTGQSEEKRGLFGKRKKKVAEVHQTITSEPAEVANSDYSDAEFAGPAGDMGLPQAGAGVSVAEAGSATEGVSPFSGASSAGVAGGVVGGAIESGMVDLGGINFGDAGSNHEETGYFSEAEDEEFNEGPPTIANRQVEIPENQENSSGLDGSEYYDSALGQSGNFAPVPTDESVLTGDATYGVIPAPIPESNKYDVVPPVYDTDEKRDLTDDEPVITDRIVLVTGDRGSGVTTKCINLAVEAVGSGVKTLIIDLDFAKHGVLGALENYGEFVKSNHTVSGGRPYEEDGLDFLSDGYGSGMSGETLEWVEDSRNYANYNKIIIDCPIEYIKHLESFVDQVGIVYMLDGSQAGLMNSVVLLDDRDRIDNQLALTFRDKGIFCVIRKEDDYHESLEGLKKEVAIDRVNWLGKLA